MAGTYGMTGKDADLSAGGYIEISKQTNINKLNKIMSQQVTPGEDNQGEKSTNCKQNNGTLDRKQEV